MKNLKKLVANLNPYDREAVASFFKQATDYLLRQNPAKKAGNRKGAISRVIDEQFGADSDVSAFLRKALVAWQKSFDSQSPNPSAFEEFEWISTPEGSDTNTGDTVSDDDNATTGDDGTTTGSDETETGSDDTTSDGSPTTTDDTASDDTTSDGDNLPDDMVVIDDEDDTDADTDESTAPKKSVANILNASTVCIIILATVLLTLLLTKFFAAQTFTANKDTNYVSYTLRLLSQDNKVLCVDTVASTDVSFKITTADLNGTWTAHPYDNNYVALDINKQGNILRIAVPKEMSKSEIRAYFEDSSVEVDEDNTYFTNKNAKYKMTYYAEGTVTGQ